VNRVQTKPSISVLMAAFNAEATILRSIRSTLLALGSQDELLIFLDGCTDKTSEMVSRIKDKRLRVFESQTNIGRVAARNRLYMESKGEIISILDADDLSLPWRFVVTRTLLRKYDVIFGSALIFGELSVKLPFLMTFPSRLSSRECQCLLATRNPFVHSTAAFRKSIVSENRPLYEDIVAEEYDLWIRFAIEDRNFIKTATPLSAYRRHKNQVSQTPGFSEKGESCMTLNSHRALLISKLVSFYQFKGPDELFSFTENLCPVRLEKWVIQALRGLKIIGPKGSL